MANIKSEIQIASNGQRYYVTDYALGIVSTGGSEIQVDATGQRFIVTDYGLGITPEVTTGISSEIQTHTTGQKYFVTDNGLGVTATGGSEIQIHNGQRYLVTDFGLAIDSGDGAYAGVKSEIQTSPAGQRYYATDEGLFVMRGWTAGVDCAVAASDVSTIYLKASHTFTDAATGWSFEKTSPGRQCVGDIQFDNPISITTTTQTAWHSAGTGTSTIAAGKLTAKATDIIIIESPITLETTKDYDIVIDVDTFGDAFDVFIGGGANARANITSAGIATVTLQSTAISINNVGIRMNDSTLDSVINSISIIESVGVVETSPSFTSPTTSPNDELGFVIAWTNDPTQGDVTTATYDDTTGDYANPAKTTEVLGAERITNTNFDHPLSAWELLSGSPDLSVDGQITFTSTADIVRQFTLEPDGFTTLNAGDKLELNIVMDDISSTLHGFQFDIAQGVNTNIGKINKSGTYEISISTIPAGNQIQLYPAFIGTLASFSVQSFSLKKKEQVAKPLTSKTITLTNCKDL